MATYTPTKRARNESMAIAKRNDKADAHRALMAQHAERRAKHAVEDSMYATALSEWERTGFGPRPVDPAKFR